MHAPYLIYNIRSSLILNFPRGTPPALQCFKTEAKRLGIPMSDDPNIRFEIYFKAAHCTKFYGLNAQIAANYRQFVCPSPIIVRGTKRDWDIMGNISCFSEMMQKMC